MSCHDPDDGSCDVTINHVTNDQVNNVVVGFKKVCFYFKGLLSLLRTVACHVTRMSLFRMALCYEQHVTIKHFDLEKLNAYNKVKVKVFYCHMFFITQGHSEQ